MRKSDVFSIERKKDDYGRIMASSCDDQEPTQHCKECVSSLLNLMLTMPTHMYDFS